MLTKQVDFNSEFPIKKNVAYFNNASYTPMSRSAIDSITSSLSQYSDKGPSDEFYLQLKEDGNLARERLGNLISVPPEDIVFTESATQSINLVANGLKVNKGNTIVTRGGASEHPSNYLPWHYYADAKKIRIIDITGGSFGAPDLSELDSVLKETKARLVVMSHVLYNFGSVMPVADASKIAHERGSLFFLDTSQSIGNIPVDLRAIDPDFAAGTAAKWLCGPLGLGFFYCKRESLNNLEPLNYGPNSCTYKADGSYQTLDSSWKLQEGFRNWAYCHGLSSAIDLINKVSITSVRKSNMKLSDRIIDALKGMPVFELLGGADERIKTSIIPIGTKSSLKPLDVVQRLARDGITIAEREINERKILRISPHFYNDEIEVEKLIQCLKRTSA